MRRKGSLLYEISWNFPVGVDQSKLNGIVSKTSSEKRIK